MNNPFMNVKSSVTNSRTDIPLGDYIAEGLEVVLPDDYFPNLVVGDKANHPWPHLRRRIGHNWYCDGRAPQVGFLNRDEAVLLYNLALPFKGKSALEIGCWMGWSTCHLALAGLALDAIDPALGLSENATSVRQSLAAAGVLSSVRLYGASSPDGVKQIAELRGTKWNFFFIDGDHEGAAPERDARQCLQYAADDALIVFHDMVSPDVERGLDVFRQEGWETLIYQTMQIMGVAWRGNVRPAKHIPDPSIVWSLPLHLAKYRVSGSSAESEVSRLSQLLTLSEDGATKCKSENACLQAELLARYDMISSLQAEVAAGDVTIRGLQADLTASKRALENLASQAARLEADLNSVSHSILQGITAPLGASQRATRRLRRFMLEARYRRAILRSGLFDSSYYLAQNPDVAEAGIDPLWHYLRFGAAEGRDPSPFFDTSYYLESNRDVAKAGVNPLAHYVVRGAKEGRGAHPLVRVPLLPGFSSASSEEARDGLGSVCAPVLPLEGGVCIVTPDIVGPVRNGGIGTASYHFARTLVEGGHTVSILFTGDLTDSQKSHWRNFYREMGINFIALSDTPAVKQPVFGSSWFLDRSWRVFQFLKQAKLDVVHFQDWQANGFWSIKAKHVGLAFAETTLAVMTHSSTKWINQGMQQYSADPFETAKLIWAETYAIEHCDLLLSPSQYMFSWAAENQIRCPAQMARTPYVYTDESPAGEAVSPVDNEHLIFFGRLETRKGLHVFGEALRLLKAEGGTLPRQVSFLGKNALVMGRPSAEYLSELKQELDAVEFHIITDLDHIEALRYIRESRGLVVIPSILDNYPLTVLECIQNGIPFFAAATGGIPEMVDDRICFEPAPAALAELLSTRHTIDHVRLEHKYSSDLAKNMWLDLHVELLQEASRSSRERHRIALEGRKVSVCIPFYNHQRYLEALIEAFARQRYSNFEVILVDDGSGAEAKCEFDRLARETRDARFRFLSTENQGPGPARNFAVSHAGGELLVFFDADNIPKNEYFLATLVRAVQESGADCVTCPYDIVDADRTLPTDADVISTYRPIGPCLETGFFENTLGDATMIIDRTVFEKLGGFPSNRESWEDHEFLLKLCFRGFRLESVPEALFYYRQSSLGRNGQVNLYMNYESLFRQLGHAPAADLARILGTVTGPMILKQRNPKLAATVVAG